MSTVADCRRIAKNRLFIGLIAGACVVMAGVLPLPAEENAASPFNGQAITMPVNGIEPITAAPTPAAAAPVQSSDPSGQYGFVNVNTRLNVRDKPWGAIIGKLYDGDKIHILAREGDWLKINWNGGVAYVHSAYVSVGKPADDDGGSNNGGDNGTGPAVDLPPGSLDPARFGYDSKRFKSVFDVVEKFASANKAYVFGAGHTYKEGYTERTDCSGFVGQFIQKMAAASGVPPVFSKRSWFPSSQVYKTQYTKKVTSAFPPPNPRDLIKPGDIFVMNPGSSGIGHVGLFMGYTSSGQPIIAHSTPSKVKSDTRIAGRVGSSGVRIEILPRRYESRWAGVFRVNNMDQMLDKLSGS